MPPHIRGGGIKNEAVLSEQQTCSLELIAAMQTSSHFGVHILPGEVTKNGRRQVDVCNCVKTEDMQLYRPAAVELEGHSVERIAPTRPLVSQSCPH